MQNIPPRRYFEWTQSSPTVTVQTCSLFDVHAMIKLQFETVVKSKSMRRKKTCRSFENEGGSGRVQQVLRSWNCLQRKYRRWAFFRKNESFVIFFVFFFLHPDVVGKVKAHRRLSSFGGSFVCSKRSSDQIDKLSTSLPSRLNIFKSIIFYSH